MPEIMFKGRILKLDEPDLELLNAHSWSWTRGGYLVSKVASGPGKRRSVTLHRLIMGDPIGFWIDHINRDPTDCRRINMRLCTPYDNARNRKHWKSDPGVTWNPGRKRWQVVIRDGGKPRWFGYFDTQEEAQSVAAEARKHIVSILWPL